MVQVTTDQFCGSWEAMQLPGFGRQRKKPCSFCAGIGALSATDMFCGAGGSSLGLEGVCCPYCGRALIEVVQAMNHWELAVEAHNENFPYADHDVHDVHRLPPSRFRRTDILWASPECVNHASCKGKHEETPEAERSRATFDDIVRFAEYHRYDAVIVENVVEARLWCEHPKCACGARFDAWFQTMLALGYEGQIVYYNSQFAWVPQSRDRMYVVFWRVGVPRPHLDYRPICWCSSCEMIVRGVQDWKPASRGSSREVVFEWGRYGANYLYRCPNDGCGAPVAPAVLGASIAVDRSLPIERIGEKPPKHCNTCGRTHPVVCNTRRRIRVGCQTVGRRHPLQVQVGGHLYERDGYARVWSLDEPMRTVCTTSTTAIVALAGGQETGGSAAGEPTHATTGSDGGEAVVLRAGGQSPVGRGLGEPVNTITAHDRQIALVIGPGGPTGSSKVRGLQAEPVGAVMPDSHAAIVIQNMQNNVGRCVGEPGPPVTTGGNQMLVQVNRGPKSARDVRGGGRPLGEPTRTIAGHGELALVEMRGQHGALRPGEVPAHTITAGGTHHGLLVYNGVPGFVRELGDTTGTVTARDKQALLVPYCSSGVASSEQEPLGAITTYDREALVLTDADIDEMFMRMLQWPELLRAQAMHMHGDGSPYRLTAQRRNSRGKLVELSNELRTRMIGNAVSSHVATMLGWSLAISLAGSSLDKLAGQAPLAAIAA